MHTHHVLVVGGAGYIGSHVTHQLFRAGYTVTVLDAVRYGQSPQVRRSSARVVIGDYGDRILLNALFRQHHFMAVVYCGGVMGTTQSITDPAEFYTVNVAKMQVLLEAMRTAGVRTCIYSSSMKVYGTAAQVPTTERASFAPICPYARTKVAAEHLLQDYAQAYDMRYVSLRHANVAGAEPAMENEQQYWSDRNLIPRVLTALYDEQPITIYGATFDTVDGTMVRDYVHVHDVAAAYVLALNYLRRQEASDIFNIGSGQGTSVKQVIAQAEKITGGRARMSIVSPPSFVRAVSIAENTKAQHILGWRPTHSALALIIASAHQRQQQLRNK